MTLNRLDPHSLPRHLSCCFPCTTIASLPCHCFCIRSLMDLPHPRTWRSILFLAAFLYLGICVPTVIIVGVDEKDDDYEPTEALYISRRLGDAARPPANSLKLALVHKTALLSPLGGLEQRIMQHATMDAARLEALCASARRNSRELGALKSAADPPATASAAAGVGPAPASEPAVSEYESRVISGAFLPIHAGNYFVEFSMGTPRQQLRFAVDSASDLLWAPCSMCAACTRGPQKATFLAPLSSTFTPIGCSSEECNLVASSRANCTAAASSSCTYVYSYSDGTLTTGIFAYDTVTMLSSHGRTVPIPNVAFGCGMNNTGNITQVGGVIGLGQGAISFTSQVGYLFGSRFSYCFTSLLDPQSSSLLVFGGEPNPRQLTGPLQYTPFVNNPFFESNYYIGIQALRINGATLPIDPAVWGIDSSGNGGSIIDSGTTLSYFFQSAYNVIIEAFKTAIAYPLAPATAGLDLCYNVSGIVRPTFPAFDIAFEGGAILEPPAENYFLSPEHDLRCLAMGPSLDFTVLGNLMQQNYYVQYDRLNSRLGLARAQCSAV